MDEFWEWKRKRKKHLCPLAIAFGMSILFVIRMEMSAAMPVSAVSEQGDEKLILAEDVSSAETVDLPEAAMAEDVSGAETVDLPEAAWSTSSGWQYGSFLDAVSGVEKGGTIVLLTDVSLPTGITVSRTMSIMSNDADNPCTIKNIAEDTDDKQERGRIFTVTGGTLQLSNIILDGGSAEGVTAYHPLVLVKNAGVALGPGAALQNAENLSPLLGGGAINIRLGQAIMYDGSKISGCKAKHGGGVEINSSGAYQQAMFGMAGGCIENCEAEDGGGVFVNIGAFQMLGGEIVNNCAARTDSEDSSQRTEAAASI